VQWKDDYPLQIEWLFGYSLSMDMLLDFVWLLVETLVEMMFSAGKSK
jgi:hypothetical protein